MELRRLLFLVRRSCRCCARFAHWLAEPDCRLVDLLVGEIKKSLDLHSPGGVIGGALGNMTDRVFRGAVADFFYFHSTLPVGPLANYVFNLADVGITIGAGLLLYESLTLGPSSTPDHSHDRSDIK